MNVIASMAMVTTRPFAYSEQAMPPAASIWLRTQPPKISPFALVSAGMAETLTVTSPRGSTEIDALSIPQPLVSLSRAPRWRDVFGRLEPISTIRRPPGKRERAAQRRNRACAQSLVQVCRLRRGVNRLLAPRRIEDHARSGDG